MAHFVDLSDVWHMLEACLQGHTRKANEEYWTVKFNGRSYRRIPVGPHGKKTNVRVQSGHIRSLVRFFGIKAQCYAAYVEIH